MWGRLSSGSVSGDTVGGEDIYFSTSIEMSRLSGNRLINQEMNEHDKADCVR